MEKAILEQEIDELLRANNKEKSNKFCRFRGEIMVLEHVYEENNNNLTHEQKNRLSTLEKRLGYMRFGMSAVLAGVSLKLGLASYLSINSILQNGANVENITGAATFGVTSLMFAFPSLYMAYMGSRSYSKGKAYSK